MATIAYKVRWYEEMYSDLDDVQSTISSITGFDTGAKFETEEEVWDYFRFENLARCYPEGCPCQEDLDRMAVLVIRYRWHMARAKKTKGYKVNWRVEIFGDSCGVESAISNITGFDTGAEFETEEEVWNYFRFEDLARCYPDELECPCQEDLDRMAELVIKNRWHMAGA